MKISSFTGRYRFLSNFWPVEIFLDGDKYKSVEHAYQAAKTLDDIERFNIRQAPTASEAKKLGRKIKKIRPNWDKIKLLIMESLLRQKFNIAKHPILAQALLETYPNELIEGNYWGDTFWGVCNNKGKNHLGRLLMKIRDELTL